MYNNDFNPQNILNSAMQFMHAGEFKRALANFLLLEKQGMKDPRLYKAIGSAYERLSNREGALEYFKRSLALVPNQADLVVAIGNILTALKQPDGAIEYYKSAIKLKLNDPNIWQKLAINYLNVKNFNGALDAFDKVLEIEPNNSKAIVGKSRAMQALGHNMIAEFLLAVLENKPNDSLVLKELAWWYKQQGEFQNALHFFLKITKIDSTNTEAFEDLSLVFLDLGDPLQALAALKEGLSLDPQHRNLNKLLCSLKFELAQEDYLDHYRNMSRDVMPAPVFADYINNLVNNGKIIQAQDELKTIESESDKHNVATHLQLSIWAKQMQHELIINFICNLVKNQRPISTPLVETLTRAYIAIGEGKLASDTIKPLLDSAPQNQYYWALYTTALRQMNSDEYYWLCDYDTLLLQEPIQLDSKSKSIDDFNSTLRSVLDELHVTKQQPLEQSLKGGTQTLGNLLCRDHSVIRELKTALLKTSVHAFKAMIKDETHPAKRNFGVPHEIGTSWSVRLNKQGFHLSHIHPKGWYSSAYYVDLPIGLNDVDKEGYLHIGKPGLPLNAELEAECWVKPEVGKLVLFPSYFWHGTEPFSCETPRLSVAFDLTGEA